MPRELSERAKLPMDLASRMERAKQMGFHTDIMLARGTNREFKAFDPAKLGSMTDAPTARLGVWTEVRTPDSPLADFYAQEAARRSGGNPTVIPLLHRAEKRGRITLKGDESEPAMAATISDLWDRDNVVIIDNFTVVKGRKGSILVVKDPAQLRAPSAKFNPAKRNSSDLLAGFAGSGLLGSTLRPLHPSPKEPAE